MSILKRLAVAVGLLCLAAPAAHASGSIQSQESGVPAVQAAAFTALRGAPSATIPTRVKTFASQSPATNFGARVSQTRRIPAPSGGYWDIIPGSDGVCLYIESEQGGTCVDTASALAGKLNVSTIPFPDHADPGNVKLTPDLPQTYLGLAPDGTTGASATLVTGEIAKGDIAANGLYRVAGRSLVSRLALTRVAGKPLTATPIRHKRDWRNAAFGHGKPRAKAAETSSCIPYILGCSPYVYTPQGSYGGYYPVIQIVAQTFDTGIICVNAQNWDGTWAGSGLCGVWPHHAFNGSMRWPCAAAQTVNTEGTAHYTYNS